MEGCEAGIGDTGVPKATGPGPPGSGGFGPRGTEQPSLCGAGDGEGDMQTPSATAFPIR